MDYNKLTKDQLIEMCNERELPFSKSWNKDRLIELLIADGATNDIKKDEAEVKNEEVKSTKEEKSQIEDKTNENKKTSANAKRTGIALGGTILNIVGTSLIILFCSLAFISILGAEKTNLYEWNHPNWEISLVIYIIFVIGAIISLVFSIIFLRGGSSKVPVGVLALIFGGILGGILILCSKDEETI